MTVSGRCLDGDQHLKCLLFYLWMQGALQAWQVGQQPGPEGQQPGQRLEGQRPEGRQPLVLRNTFIAQITKMGAQKGVE